MTAADSVEHKVARRDASGRRGRSLSALRPRHGLPLVVLIVGLAASAALSLTSLVLYRNNEKRLLDLRVRQAASVLTEAVPGIQTVLASAAELAQATNGDVVKFKSFVAPYVGAKREFPSVSLWRAAAVAHPVAIVGLRPVLVSMPRAQPFIQRAARGSGLKVVGLLTPPDYGLGYAYAAPGSSRGFVVYAETPLPRSRRTAIQSNSAFSDIDYAIYLGRTQQASHLLLTSVKHLPFSRRTAVSTVPFGDNSLTLVVAARHALGGALPQRLPWIIALVGTVLSVGAALLTLRLIERRRAAEGLAGRLDRIASENRRLYAEQRDIAQTLQHALLPERLPAIPGAEAEARYEAGERGVDIGGDWYDAIVLEDDRVLLVVGDVSGHGVRAAGTMAALRHAIHAYAVEGDAPPVILRKLGRLISVSSGGQLATVLCVMVDVRARNVSVTSAGHLPPLLISDGRAEYLHPEVGLPVGVDQSAAYTSTSVAAPPGATLLAFTDGLVERRGEDLDAGLQRLCEVARANHIALDDLLHRVVAEVRIEPAEDDTAIVGFRWLE